MRRFAFFVLVVCLAAFSSAAEIQDCSKPDSPGKLIKVEVANCTEEDQVCIIKKGVNATIQIEFETKEEVKNLVQEVHGVIHNIPVPFRLPSDNACIGADLTCPLVVGTHKYIYQLYVKPTYPSLRVTVKWQLTDPDTKKDVVCIAIPAQIR